MTVNVAAITTKVAGGICACYESELHPTVYVAIPTPILMSHPANFFGIVV